MYKVRGGARVLPRYCCTSPEKVAGGGGGGGDSDVCLFLLQKKSLKLS